MRAFISSSGSASESRGSRKKRFTKTKRIVKKVFEYEVFVRERVETNEDRLTREWLQQCDALRTEQKEKREYPYYTMPDEIRYSGSPPWMRDLDFPSDFEKPPSLEESPPSGLKQMLPPDAKIPSIWAHYKMYETEFGPEEISRFSKFTLSASSIGNKPDK